MKNGIELLFWISSHFLQSRPYSKAPAKLCMISLAFVSATLLQVTSSAAEMPEFTISDGGTSVNKNGIQWLQKNDLPASLPGIPSGMELGSKTFKEIILSPDNSRAALVITNSNNEWVAMLRIIDRKAIAGHLLYGGSVRKIIWSPDGDKLLIESNEASGLPGIILIFLSDGQTPLRINALLAAKLAYTVQLKNPEWDKTGKSLTFDVYDATGKAGKRYKLDNDFTVLSILEDLEVEK